MTENRFTLTISNIAGVSDDIVAAVRSATEFSIQTLGRYLGWMGEMDFEINIRSKDDPANPYPDVDGILPSSPQVTFDPNGSAKLVPIQEALTGIDPNGTAPDAGFTIYLGRDGTMRNYGAPVWIDPHPVSERTPDLPGGHHDFISIAIHEIFHCFGFFLWPEANSEFFQKTEVVDGVRYYVGESVQALVGPRGIPLDHGDHYGQGTLDYHPVSRGLMYQYGNYSDNRWEIGRLDLAVLHDLGWQIKTVSGLPLTDLDDRFANVDGTDAADQIFGDFRANRLQGLSGDDVIEGGGGDDVIAGGAGLDRAVFSDAYANYVIKVRGDTITVQHQAGEGRDTLTGIERLQFQDALIALRQAQDLFHEAYAALNADLFAAFGLDGQALIQHYLDYGKREGRAVSGFSAEAYAAQNADLYAAFGLDARALVQHYIEYGRTEGRVSDGFDADAYAALNADLYAAFGLDAQALVRHYIEYGRTEGRAALGFDADAYAAQNADLYAAFGTDRPALIAHYREYGRTEERESSGFGVEAYAALNPDVVAAYGFDKDALIRHYLDYGRAEGRDASFIDPLQITLLGNLEPAEPHGGQFT